MRDLRAALLIALLGCLQVNVAAQNSDIRLRTGFKLNKEANKRLEFTFESQFRMKNNMSDFDKILFEPSLKFEVFKNFRIISIYRYSWKQNKQKIKFGKSRINIYLAYKFAIGSDWDLKTKSGIEYETRSFHSGYNHEDDSWTNRSELILSYDIFGTPLSTEIGGELFINIINPKRFEQVRLASELSYRLSKNTKLLFQYLIDFKLQKAGRLNHIFVLMYRIKI